MGIVNVVTFTDISSVYVTIDIPFGNVQEPDCAYLLISPKSGNHMEVAAITKFFMSLKFEGFHERKASFHFYM